LSQQLQAQAPDTGAPKSILGELPLTNQQAQHLGVRSHTTESVSRVVLFAVSANVSYQHAEEDVELFVSKLPLKPSSG